MVGSVAFVAAPYGYGPTSKAIAIASYLPKEIHSTFLGDGPPLQLARSSGVFSSHFCLPLNTEANKAGEYLKQFDVLVFVNSTRFITAALAKTIKIVLVETLAWLRDAAPACHPLLSAFFAQKFFDYKFPNKLTDLENFHEVGVVAPASITGFVGRGRVPRSFQRKQPLIQCGGLYSANMINGADELFLSKTCDVVTGVSPRSRFVIPGRLRRRATSCATQEVELIEASPLSIHEHLYGSEFALNTSGIEFTYEAILMRVPVLFLPPFNASQALQLDYHLRNNPSGVLFEQKNDHESSKFVGLHVMSGRIQEEGMKGAWKTQFSQLLDRFNSFGVVEKKKYLNELSASQQLMMSNLRLDGAREIAEHCLEQFGLRSVVR
ncbi:MAG: hypothetical protein GY748_24770 [Planctomycetaceae bacterium]|nr:hypothetical protein [Planctomycetaceae bacterium]